MAKLKSAKELGITERQRRNIAKLTMFVKNCVHSSSFSILSYNCNFAFASDPHYECGTTACFCGYGPLAGVKANRTERWGDYSQRCFTGKKGGASRIWNLLFSTKHINNKKLAVLRGAYFLMHGLPDLPFWEMSKWEAPKGFKPNWKAIRELAQNEETKVS